MRTFSRASRLLLVAASGLIALIATLGIADWSQTSSAAGSTPEDWIASTPTRTSTTTSTTPDRSTDTTVEPAAVVPVAVLPAEPVFATGNDQLDALLPTLPAVLFEGGAQVHFGYNPVDCCHAGGYNPDQNEVWISEKALGSAASLTYVTVHELAHGVHLNSARADTLTAAVAGAPVVRAGSPWDDTEKVADCIAWALFPAETGASGLTYWGCPDPWRAQVIAALR